MTRSVEGHGNYDVFACPLTTVRDLLNVAESVKFPQVKNSQFKYIYQCKNLVKLQATCISDRSVSEFRVEVRYTKKTKKMKKNCSLAEIRTAVTLFCSPGFISSVTACACILILARRFNDKVAFSGDT